MNDCNIIVVLVCADSSLKNNKRGVRDGEDNPIFFPKYFGEALVMIRKKGGKACETYKNSTALLTPVHNTVDN